MRGMRMSDHQGGAMSYDARLIDVERRQENLSSDMKVLQHDFTGLRTDVVKLSSSIENHHNRIMEAIGDLQQKDAKRGQAWDFKTAATVCGGLAAIAYVGWWLIATSPAIEELKNGQRALEGRIGKLDDPEIGKVSRMQEQMRWWPDVRK